MIAVLDASTFISAALKPDSVPEQVLLRVLRAPNRLIISAAVECEYREVLFRPKFDRFVSVARRQRILDLVLFAAEVIEVTDVVQECLDPKDNKYLELAATGTADAIITSDLRHLLPMHPWRGTDILSPSTFLVSRWCGLPMR